jgi:mRNA interferase RelE/StbE
MFEVVLSRSAATYFQRLDRPWQERVRAALESLREDPFGHSKALVNGEGRRSTRVGALRIIFTVDTSAKVVAVSHIGPRGQVYRRL